MHHGGPRAAPTPPSLQGPSRNLLLNGKSYPTKVRLIRGGSLPPVKRRRMNWIDAPDDVFYMATEETRWGLLGQRGRAGSGVAACPCHSGVTLRSQEDPQAALVLGDQARRSQALQAHRPAPEPGPAAAAAPARACQRRAHRHRGLGALRPQTAPRPPSPAQNPLLGHLGETCRLTYSGRPGAGVSFVLLFGWRRVRSRRACTAPHRTASHRTAGSRAGGVLLCSVEGAILNFIFITFFVDELKLCNLHLEC